ncbi:PQQ-dependent sugar dehydrogenase [Winogradskyella sp. PE311]|uniref:PQQ-dependent sugar dehydrogenase n=1 Tax=Winogradskyella sp. PE311 TaxID=3366943 RepID=UPI00397EE16F
MKDIVALLFLLFISFSFAQDLDTELFASGLNRPVNIKHAGDDRLFIAEQNTGRIKIINANGTVQSTPFLDIDAIVSDSGGERGLLGLAFHPNYASNGYLFVNYINNSGDTVISRFSRNATNPSIADSNSELKILEYAQPFSNHNGGELQFGPDGYLYISSGDGGSGGDPLNNSQNLTNLLGKLLRIDVNNSTVANPYAIPADNPFVGNASASDEIWSYGLRNPWKFSFDRTTGDVWIADVGQNEIEEINSAPSTSAGLNYGWRCYEGNSEYNGNASECNGDTTLTFPVAQYTHNTTGGCSITGGYRYRGTEHPGLEGLYFFSDICNQDIGYLRFENGSWNMTIEPFSLGGPVAFGEDVNGEIYFSTLGGNIYKIIDNDSLGLDDNNINTFSIYPNPSINEVNLDFSSFQTLGSVEIFIFDIQGKVIQTISRNTETIQSISTANLKSGIYIIKVTSNNGEEAVKKLVVN